MKEDLEPCPFCGFSRVEVKRMKELDCYAFWCFKCGAYGPEEEDAQDAASKWNERK